ncbi:hypothetical protein IW261DRAFT_1565968 [Armillaria novae-zelandiae]|uniref:Uncharacterized protein n=1 Tax=Armillaria novae-zelandiae TaxID=153914 RepID=A0AA39TBA8_9AGAR|nr:hypothetical protein IW261DRAFT_1565968 [Armillaria novae-zelandiae]
MSARSSTAERIPRTRSQTMPPSGTATNVRVSSAGTRQHMHNSGETNDDTTTPKLKVSLTRKAKSTKIDNVTTAGAEDVPKATVTHENQKMIPTATANTTPPLNGVPQGDGEGKKAVEAEKRVNEVMAGTAQTQDSNHEDGSPPDTNPVVATTRSPKRKPEDDEDDDAFVPGQNQFTPLLKTTAPPSKRARSNLPDDQVTETAEEGTDELEEMYATQEMEWDEEDAQGDEQKTNPPSAMSLTAKAPKATAIVTPIPPPMIISPFAKRLPDDNVDDGVAPTPPQHVRIPLLAPVAARVTPVTGELSTPQRPRQGPTVPSLAMMVAPVPSAIQTPQQQQGLQTVTIYREHVGMTEPHTISPQHVFHNYCWEQINDLLSSPDPNDILIVVWGLEFRNLTSTTEQRIENALKAYFETEDLGLQIALPSPPPSYYTKERTAHNAQPFTADHTGTPLPFYVCGLSKEQRAEVLDAEMITTNMDSYIVLDPTDFITDFVFTIDGLNAPSDIQGQRLVEKILKDKLYTTPKVWTFLQSHHDAIDASIPPEDIPFLVILSLEARSLWIEGRNGEPGRQAWNIWMAHPTKIPACHNEWISMLKTAFPIRSGTGFGGTARVIRVPFFCKGCKGGSHPTGQCPMKEKLGDILRRPNEGGASRGRNGGRGGRGGRSGDRGGRPAKA